MSKIIGNKYARIAIGETIWSERTIGLGFGRTYSPTYDRFYFMLAFVFYLYHLNFYIIIPRIKKESEESNEQ